MKITLDIPDPPEGVPFFDGPNPAIPPVSVTVELGKHRITFTGEMYEPVELDYGPVEEVGLADLTAPRIWAQHQGSFTVPKIVNLKGVTQQAITPKKND